MELEKQTRGKLTQRVIDRGRELLNYNITTLELRLMPYIVYEMMNEQKLDTNKINSEEYQILRKWKEAGHIAGPGPALLITKEFWNILCELVFLAYVDVEK